MIKNVAKLSLKTQKVRKLTRKRLENIALHYLERFDSSANNLRQVLGRRVFKYTGQVADFDVNEAENWIEEIIESFEKLSIENVTP